MPPSVLLLDPAFPSASIPMETASPRKPMTMQDLTLYEYLSQFVRDEFCYSSKKSVHFRGQIIISNCNFNKCI